MTTAEGRCGSTRCVRDRAERDRRPTGRTARDDSAGAPRSATRVLATGQAPQRDDLRRPGRRSGGVRPAR
ncbi:hypothetical protein HBB16_10000 [Pseudonocardia sp. MCCB 268]|nr:hypothetical protein [Pseudonocardia cytotoxica]